MKYWVMFAVGVVLFLTLATSPGPVAFWGIVGISGLVVYLASGWRRIQQTRAWKDYARSCDGEFAQSAFKVDQGIESTFGPEVLDAWKLATSSSRAATLRVPAEGATLVFDTRPWDEMEGPTRRRAWYTRVLAPLQDHPGFRFELVPRGEAVPYQQQADVEPVIVAQPAVARWWQVLSSDEEKMRDLLADTHLRDALREQGTVFLRTVPTSEGDALCLEEREIVLDSERLEEMRRLFLVVLLALTRLASARSSIATTRPLHAPALTPLLPGEPEVPTDPQLRVEPPAGIAPPTGAATRKAAAEWTADLPGVDVAEEAATPPPALSTGAHTVVGPEPGGEERMSEPEDTRVTRTPVPEPVLPPVPRPEESALSEAFAGPGVGQTAADDRWEVTLIAYGPYEQVVGHPPKSHVEGVLVAADFRASNLQRWTGNLTPAEAWIENASGSRISPAGETSSVEKGFWLDWVQGGQSLERRLVFDVDPSSHPVALNILGLRFRLPE